MAIDGQRLTDDLKALGLQTADTVMMHSSLSALGMVEGGAETVVDALFDAIGPDGTLMVPACRGNVWGDPKNFAITDCCPCPQRFCPSDQPGFQGIIPETVRRRPGSLRSCHPTCSWAALGPAAEDLLKDHRNSPTMCGRSSPFEELVRLDGCVLVLGVMVNTITLWHHYEEILQVPYMGHYWPKQRYLNHCVPGRRIQYDYPGIMQEVCKAAGVLTTGPVGKSTSGLLRAKDFDSFMATIMVDDPYCMVLRPPTRECGDLAVDALRKAEAMLRAWAKGPRKAEHVFDYPPAPIAIPSDGDHVRKDCPAFAGLHRAGDRDTPLCKANSRHPDLFRHGGVFDKFGPTTCDRCSWNAAFPR